MTHTVMPDTVCEYGSKKEKQMLHKIQKGHCHHTLRGHVPIQVRNSQHDKTSTKRPNCSAVQHSHPSA